MNPKMHREILSFQQTEITEFEVYKMLAGISDSPRNHEIMTRIGKAEQEHYEIWKKYTGQDIKASRLRVWKYYWISRLLGITFGLKLLERSENLARKKYTQYRDTIPEIKQLIQDEVDHEKELIALLDEEKLQYTGSIVLGLNDALVELTGALAGLTLALNNPKLVALTGTITGIAAALSMGASEYLSTKSENTAGKSPLRASFYTFVAYIVAVLLLIAPFILLSNLFLSLALTLCTAVGIIAFFNYYLAVVEDTDFVHRFMEMLVISLGIATLSFGIGYIAKVVVGDI